MREIIVVLILLAERSICTTEWFGDLRAHLNPPRLPPFYDIVYDESECPFGLESIAIPEYVYFGEMIATKSVREHSVCLQFCLETAQCKAVNYFESIGKKDQERGFCELLVETQYDNPRLMRPFKKATYYEKIRCRNSNEEEEQPFEFDSNGREGKELLLASGGPAQKKGEPVSEEKQHSNKNVNDHQRGPSGGNFTSGEKGRTNGPEPINPRWNLEKETTLKKLAQKVQEFNLRFRS